MQTDAKLLVSNTQHCWVQHVASVSAELQQCYHLLALVAYSVKPVKLLDWCKRTKHGWPKTPNNMQQCYNKETAECYADQSPGLILSTTYELSTGAGGQGGGTCPPIF